MDVLGLLLGWAFVTWLFIIFGRAVLALIANREKARVEKRQQNRINAVNGGFAEVVTGFEEELQSMPGYKPEIPYEEYLDYLDSKEWKIMENKIIKRDKNTCMQCGQKFAKSELEVHHITYQRFRKEKLTDLVTLCEFHHELLHEYHGENAGYYPLLTMAQLSEMLSKY